MSHRTAISFLDVHTVLCIAKKLMMMFVFKFVRDVATSLALLAFRTQCMLLDSYLVYSTRIFACWAQNPKARCYLVHFLG